MTWLRNLKLLRSKGYQVLFGVSQTTLLNDEPVQSELDGGALHDLFVDGVLGDHAVHANL